MKVIAKAAAGHHPVLRGDRRFESLFLASVRLIGLRTPVTSKLLQLGDHAAALVSCTVTLGAAKRISAAAKASISRRNAWRRNRPAALAWQ